MTRKIQDLGLLAASALILVLGARAAAAQAPPPAQAASPTPADRPSPTPPAGQYAPPPAGSEAAGSTYDRREQANDRDYAEQYSRWASRYCVDRRSNTAAGAAIGGVLGAVLGSGLAGRGEHTAGAIAGGALGATAGAAIGENATPGAACPPGYVVAPGASVFYYPAPPPPAVVYGPDWYRPWVWVDGRWSYRPYRYWYWNNRAYWRPDWRPGRWAYLYRRW